MKIKQDVVAELDKIANENGYEVEVDMALCGNLSMACGAMLEKIKKGDFSGSKSITFVKK